MARNSGYGSSSSALQVEAKVVVLVVQTTIQDNMTNVIFESDSAFMVNSINGDKRKANWSIFPFLRQIWNLRHRFTSFKWYWIPHQANSATD
ncbi:hypothetical protein DVH24_002416 [Malus domestica]|uniref:RNase H type-1 domain-containing protein n=1 Tax=Malus domestica TaxID=3750 RepID=A0A498IKH7_MALDO|nr:hypothetical protein DVH24_002416 [Malus domestica]